MLTRRWWDAAAAAGAAVIAISLLTGLESTGPVGVAVALCSLALFVAGYVVVARPAIGGYSAWRLWTFLAIASIALGVGCSAIGFFAILQALAYPLVWVIGASRRHGVIGSAVIASAVFVGFAAGDGWGIEGVIAAAATAVFSGIFAIALGLWISRIAEYGEERARLLAELTAAQAEVEALSRDRGAAEERERVARDIHDTLAQTLAGLVLLAERAGRQSRDGRADDAAESIRTVEQVARDALAEARALVARTGAVPREPVFGAAVARLVDRFRAHGVAQIGLSMPEPEPDLDRDTQVVLLRCLQEALSNVSRHAGARAVTVAIATPGPEEVRLRVADDGVGFDADAVRTGYGLDGMSERVALAHGELHVASSPGNGTVLTVILPVAAPETAGRATPEGGSERRAAPAAAGRRAEGGLP